MRRATRLLGYETLENRNLLSATAEAEDVPTVRVEIPDQVVMLPATQFTVPVNIGLAPGLRGAEVSLAYDTNLLDTSDASIAAGSVWAAGGATVVANVDDAAGTISVWVFQAEDIVPQAGSLLNITFVVSGPVASGTTTRIDLTHVRLNEDQILPDPAPIPGPDETDGTIAFVAEIDPIGEGSLAGMVYADTNLNHLPDPHEAVPGVKLSLYDAQGALLQETFTDQHGWYEFRQLPAGNYRIEQRQPASMIDGGPNELDVSLAVGEHRVDQHFRELGRRPEYLFNRLMAVSVQPPGSTPWTDLVARIEETAQIDAGNTVDPAPPPVTQEIVQQGTQLIVRGTNDDDHFRFDAGATTHTVTLNGQSQTVDPAQVTSIRFIGGLGSDSAELNGVSANDQAELSPKFASLQGSNYFVTVENVEQVQIHTTGVNSVAAISDSPWNDRLVAEGDQARLETPLYTQQVRGFRRVLASSQRGGQDRLSVLEPLDFVLERTGSWLPE